MAPCHRIVSDIGEDFVVQISQPGAELFALDTGLATLHPTYVRLRRLGPARTDWLCDRLDTSTGTITTMQYADCERWFIRSLEPAEGDAARLAFSTAEKCRPRRI